MRKKTVFYLFLLAVLSVFLVGCSGSYGLRVETNFKQKIPVSAKETNYATGTKETEMEYGYRNGWGTHSGGREYYRKKETTKYDSRDEERNWKRRGHKLKYEGGK